MKIFNLVLMTSVMIGGHVAEAQSRSGARVVRGDLLHVICAEGVRIRNENLVSVFQSRPFERVRPFQGWGENRKTAVVDGRRTTFVRVQLADNVNRPIDTGFIAEQFLKLKSECPQAGAPGARNARGFDVVSNIASAGVAAMSIASLTDPKCCFFPIDNRPSASYLSGMRMFGARRSGGARSHAAADLYTDLYARVRAVAPGRVIDGPRDFYMRTFQVTVHHSGGFVVRYGEISPMRAHRGAGIERGASVRTGQVIGKVGQCINQVGRRIAPPMLHFELYSGRSNGQSLTQPGRRPYQRRADLLDPTPYLQRWERAKF